MRTVYLDNAATSFPKPAVVSSRMKDYLDQVGANVGRASYGAAQQAGLTVLSLRERLGRLLDFDDPAHVVLTAGATAGLNLVLKGLLRPGDHCLVSSMEHNAVMRPLNQLAKIGVTFDRIPCDREGRLDPAGLVPLLRPNTRLVVLAHASNVCGTVQDAAAVGALCAARGVPLVLDGAQTAGHYPISCKAFSLSALVIPGHKGLLGPSGIGAVLLAPAFARQLEPLIAGGTGSASDLEEIPAWMPDRFEAGTLNLPGVYGWEAALAFVEETGIAALRAHELDLTRRFLDGLAGLRGVRLLGTRDLNRRVGVLALDFAALDNAEAAFRLEQEFGILTRCGLHCAPSAHRTLGSFPQGCVRFSLGFHNTPGDVDAALTAIRRLTGE